MDLYSISPLRYPGGKAKLSGYIIDLLIFNNLEKCTYIELFAGGSGLALSLLINDIVDRIVINDYDKSIYAFWYSILNNTEDFINMIYDTDVTVEEWYRQKGIYDTTSDLLKMGFAAFFLNRTNRSGIIKGGILGGKNQAGKYKIDCRFNKTNLISRIEKIAQLKDRIVISNKDAVDFITNSLRYYGGNTFIYLDPPYYKKGPDLYTNFYMHEDHKKLSDTVKNYIEIPWLITYDDSSVISDLYSDYLQIKYNLNYSAGIKQQGTELMIFSDTILPLISDKIKHCI